MTQGLHNHIALLLAHGGPLSSRSGRVRDSGVSRRAADPLVLQSCEGNAELVGNEQGPRIMCNADGRLCRLQRYLWCYSAGPEYWKLMCQYF